MCVHYLRSSAVATQVARLCAFRAFASWVGARAKSLSSDDALYEYLVACSRRGAAGSHCGSVLSSLNYAVARFGIRRDTVSERCRGVALEGFQSLGLRRQARALSVRLLRQIEHALALSFLSEGLARVAGAVFFLVYYYVCPM